MFDRISHTFSLMGTCWTILKKDKEILFFPFVASLISFSMFGVLFYLLFTEQIDFRSTGDNSDVIITALILSMVFIVTFICSLCNAGIIACANIRLQGGDPRVSDGIRAMASCVFRVLGWTIITFTVGLILRGIEKRFEKVGHFMSSLLGTAWDFASFFVMPLLVVEKLSPINAVKESASKIKQTWGEHLTSNFSFGVISVLACIPVFALAGFAFYVKNYYILILAFILLIFVLLIQTTLETIFRVVMYYYVYHDFVHSEFDEVTLKECYRTQRKLVN